MVLLSPCQQTLGGVVHQSGNCSAHCLIGGPDSGGYLKFTTKYIIVGGEGGVSDFVLRVASYSFGN